MAKRKITVTVDEELVDIIERLSADSLSATVNAALVARVEALARRQALRDLLDTWTAASGVPSQRARRAAALTFDELDGVDKSRVA